MLGAAFIGANYPSDGGGESQTFGATATFDLFYQGDLLLGLIDDQQTGFTDGLGFESLEFYVIANGVEVLDQTFSTLLAAESFFQDDVINLGSSFGPDIQCNVRLQSCR